MKLPAKIESVLFVASRPLSLKKLAELVDATIDDVKASLDQLKSQYNTEDRGIQLAFQGASVQMVTSPLAAKLVADFLKAERSGELTKPSLETLTIIAYRGPIAKAEIDLIRGVNCALILRNLLIRGLITSSEDRDKMATVYEISFDFLRHLGVRDVAELPDHATLKADTRLEEYLHPPAAPSTESEPTDDRNAVGPQPDTGAPAQETDDDGDDDDEGDDNEEDDKE